MAHKKIYILILSVFLIQNIYGAMPDSSGIFASDQKVEKLAQEFDRIYFPLFLESLKCIKYNDDRLLFDFITSYNRATTGQTPIKPFEEYKTEIIPVYKESAISTTSFPLAFPIIWNDTVHKDNSWHLYFQTLNWVKEYLKSDDSDSLFTGFKIVNDWILAHTDYPDNDELYAFSDHAASVRMLVLHYAYEKYKQVKIVQPEFERRLLLSILEHIFFAGSLEKYTSNTNHGIIMDKNLIATLSDFEVFSKRNEFLSLAFKRVFEVYRKTFTSEGIHKEHSPCYHSWVANDLDALINRADTMNIEVPFELRAIRDKALEYTYNLQVDGFIPPLGDCSCNKKNQFIKNLPSSNDFKVYPLSGWAFIHDSLHKSTVIIQSDYFSLAHYQQDETSFILNVDGHDLIIDPGLYSYTPTSKFYEYMRLARAHNVLMVDNKEFDPETKNTGLSGIVRFYTNHEKGSSPKGIIELTHPHYNKIGVEVYRQFAFTSDNEMVINDLAISLGDHNYSQLFHLAPEAIINKTENGFNISWPDHPYYIMMTSNEENYRIVEGQEEPQQGWYFPEFNKVAPAPVLILEKSGRNCTFMTKIEICSSKEKYRKSGKSEKESDLLFQMLLTMERRKLEHVPGPQRWKPARK
jgi:hypothetical protein